MPIPVDLPLALPIPELFGKVLLVVSFALHILFINLSAGGFLIALVTEAAGLILRDPKLDRAAKRIALSVTVNDNLGVLLGIAPLLLISVLYTSFFYSSTTLIAPAWLSIIPLVVIGILLSYAYEFGWDRMANLKGLHLATGFLGTAVFYFIPFIFLTNINLMLYPERWKGTTSFFQALLYRNVVPRYLHFFLASLAVTGLFLAVWGLIRRRRGDLDPDEQDLWGFLIRYGLQWTLGASLLQLLVGPLVLVTLPEHMISGVVLRWPTSLVFPVGVLAAIGAIAVLWRKVFHPAGGVPASGTPRWLYGVLALLSVTVLAMATTRHYVREYALEKPKQVLRVETERYFQKVREANQAAGQPQGAPLNP